MKTDVYDTIADSCKKGLDIINDHDDYETLAIAMLSLLAVIGGICAGAKAAEKESE